MTWRNQEEMPLIWIRGAGDLATGVGVRLKNSGFKVIYGEIPQPTVIRRTVAFAAAVYEESVTVEGHTAVACYDISSIERALSKNQVPVYIGEETTGIDYFKPNIFIEGTIRKYKTEIPKELVKYTLALGPGFSAPEEVDGIIETMRGHTLGQIIWKGSALPNTGVPGEIGGYSKERVIHAPESGVITGLKAIGDQVFQGEPIASIQQEKRSENTLVYATINGILRGLINDGLQVEKGLKIADIDPRCKKEHCFTVSDKARAIGGGVLEAVMVLTLKSE